MVALSDSGPPIHGWSLATLQLPPVFDIVTRMVCRKEGNGPVANKPQPEPRTSRSANSPKCARARSPGQTRPGAWPERLFTMWGPNKWCGSPFGSPLKHPQKVKNFSLGCLSRGGSGFCPRRPTQGHVSHNQNLGLKRPRNAKN